MTSEHDGLGTQLEAVRGNSSQPMYGDREIHFRFLARLAEERSEVRGPYLAAL